MRRDMFARVPTIPTPPPRSRARIAGHGLLIAPHEGYQLERLDVGSESALRLTYGNESHVFAAALDSPESPLAEVAPGPAMRLWRIETDTFGCSWPRGFTLADDPDGLSAFVLSAASGALLWVSGPMPRERTFPVEKLADEGQHIRAIADEGENVRIDLDYVFEGEPWWQRRYVLVWGAETVLVLSAQAKALDEETASAALDELVQSIAPFHPN